MNKRIIICDRKKGTYETINNIEMEVAASTIIR